ncbi:MAG: cryptochrome/photolyase family protein [Rhodosalinus sp.]
MTSEPILYWARRDFRLEDNPALVAAAAEGPVIPVFITDEVVETHGAAPKWRLGLGAEAFGKALSEAGSRLVVRRGKALDVLRALIAETGAKAVHWNRLYDPASRRRDEAVKAGLKSDGIRAESHAGHILFEPWTVETGSGGFYKVYKPFWKAVRGRDPGAPRRRPDLQAPGTWPGSDDLADHRLGRAMNRGAAVVRPYLAVGEAAARDRLDGFMEEAIETYAEARDDLARNGTSHLSENLTYGEIGPRTCWAAGRRALEEGKSDAETFLQELVWREFAYHLAYHTPRLVSGNWREEWDAFPWSENEDSAEVLAWKQGRTGIEMVDAGMREMYVTGRMHNRVRMIVASYLTKHLMTHWKIGLKWFEDHLIDWDPASNALGWQWSAGSGPDATPYFRVFNPVTQAKRFDPKAAYRRQWIAEGQKAPPQGALDYFGAIPRRWGLSPSDPYPEPVVAPDEGRKIALQTYENREF